MCILAVSVSWLPEVQDNDPWMFARTSRCISIGPYPEPYSGLFGIIHSFRFYTHSIITNIHSLSLYLSYSILNSILRSIHQSRRNVYPTLLFPIRIHHAQRRPSPPLF